MSKKVKMELHVHTRFSKDSILFLNLLYVLCRIKRIRCIAITEHNNIYGAVAFSKLCKKRGSLIHVIVGEEIFTQTGEIIGLYLYKNIPEGLSAKETIKEIKKQNGIVYIPHPYDKKREKTVLQLQDIEDNLMFIDCIECYNGRNISSDYEVKQDCIANKYSITKVIGSDAHTCIEVGRNYLLIDEKYIPYSTEGFIQAIKGADFHKEKCILLVHKITKCVKGFKFLQKGIYELYRTFHKRTK